MAEHGRVRLEEPAKHREKAGSMSGHTKTRAGILCAWLFQQVLREDSRQCSIRLRLVLNTKRPCKTHERSLGAGDVKGRGDGAAKEDAKNDDHTQDHVVANV